MYSSPWALRAAGIGENTRGLHRGNQDRVLAAAQVLHGRKFAGFLPRLSGDLHQFGRLSVSTGLYILNGSEADGPPAPGQPGFGASLPKEARLQRGLPARRGCPRSARPQPPPAAAAPARERARLAAPRGLGGGSLSAALACRPVRHLGAGCERRSLVCPDIATSQGRPSQSAGDPGHAAPAGHTPSSRLHVQRAAACEPRGPPAPACCASLQPAALSLKAPSSPPGQHRALFLRAWRTCPSTGQWGWREDCKGPEADAHRSANLT